MSQHDGVIEDQPGGTFLTDIQALFNAILTRQAGTAKPGTTQAYEQFINTASGRGSVYRMKSDNSAEIIDGCAQDTVEVASSSATPSLIEGDHGRIYRFTNSSSVAVALPAPNARMDGWHVWLMSTDVPHTLSSAAGGYINQSGITSLEIPCNLTYLVTCDGSNYRLYGLDLRDLPQVLADGAPVNWDMSKGHIATLTAGGDRTINAPTKMSKGSFILIHKQDATGGRTPSLNAAFKWPSGYTPSWSSAANAIDIVAGYCDGTSLYCGQVQKGY